MHKAILKAKSKPNLNPVPKTRALAIQTICRLVLLLRQSDCPGLHTFMTFDLTLTCLLKRPGQQKLNDLNDLAPLG